MEPIMTHDSFNAFSTDSGIVIEEKKKGSLKMILVVLGVSLLMIILGFALGLLGGTPGRIIGFFLIWGGALVFVIALIAIILRTAINADPKITFDTNSGTVTIRGKIIPFSDIDQIAPQLQIVMGRTMVVAMMIIKGKKKSIFSTAIVVKDPSDMEDLIEALDQIIQDSKNKKDVEA